MEWKELEKNIVMKGEKLNIVESIERHVKENRLALFFENKGIKKYTYSELIKEVNKFCNYLRKLGLKKQERVFIFLPKIPEMYISILSVIKLGGVACPIFEALQTDGLELRLDRGDCDILITNKELSERLKNKKLTKKIILVDDEKIKEEIEEQDEEVEAVLMEKEDTGLMLFTSSTAGTPVAGIQIPHYGLVQQDYTGRVVLNLKKGTRYWCTAHPGWVTGSIYGVISPLSIGASVYILEGRFDNNIWINFMKENKIEVMYTAPTVLRLLKSDIKKSDFKYLERICSVGEALHTETFDFYDKLGIRIRDTYWQTETGSIVIANYKKIKRGSIGEAVNVKIKVLNGEIVIEKPFPSMMTGIYKHERMYKSYFKNDYFLCKDKAQLKEGFFYFEGRKDDIIKTKGERVSPMEIESALMKHKDVREAGVIGISDEKYGEVIKAFVVLEKGIKETEKLKEELMLFVKKNYAGHAYPKIIEFVSSLPKTNSGKIIRMKLRENFK